jgi:excisionase family DNA binding protein
MNETLTPIEAGLYLNLHVRTIHRLAKNGLIPAMKVGRRWRFKKAVLEKWLLEDSARIHISNHATGPVFSLWGIVLWNKEKN